MVGDSMIQYLNSFTLFTNLLWKVVVMILGSTVTRIYLSILYAPVLAPDREFCESEARGKYREPPHLHLVRAGNSFDPGPVWLRQEAERGAQWRRLRPDRGGDLAAAAATTGVL